MDRARARSALTPLRRLTRAAALALVLASAGELRAPDQAASQTILRVQDDIHIRLDPVMGVWFADVVLNDGIRGRFVVDTGASLCVVSPRLAEKLGIEGGPGSVILQTANGRVRAPLVRLESVRLGEAEAENVTAAVHAIGGGIDGLLGNSFLARFQVAIDTRRGVLTLRPR